MPKLKHKRPGRRKNIWIHPEDEAILKDIDNHSAFFHMALQQAAGIMAWAILKQEDPKTYLDRPPNQQEIEGFNAAFPLDPLTAKRKKPSENSQNPPELW